MTHPRTWLYVPGNRPDMIAKSLHRGADAVVVDLEDAVPPADKSMARNLVAGWLEDLASRTDERPDDKTPAIWVRINPDTVGKDLEAVRHPRLEGVVLAKSSTDLLDVMAGLATPTAAGGMIPVVALIESAWAVRQIDDIARHPLSVQLALGEADLCAELGIDPSPDRRELLSIRMALVTASAAAGLTAPIGPVNTDFADINAFAADTDALRRLGFRSRQVIHPAQIDPVHEVMQPTIEQVRAARDILDRLDDSGGGAALDRHGRMIDEAIAKQAREILNRA